MLTNHEAEKQQLFNLPEQKERMGFLNFQTPGLVVVLRGDDFRCEYYSHAFVKL
jgi:hypothetical protein